MPTDNPKISAYVPQPVYDAVKAFQEKHNLSMSQAATAIFADYLGVEEVKSGEVRLGGITLDRFEQLEKDVADLKQLKEQVSQLQQEVEQLKSTSGLPNDNASNQGSNEDNLQVDYNQSTSSLLAGNVESSGSNSLSSVFDQPALTKEQLAKRLGLGVDTTRKIFSNKSNPYEYIAKHDPDGITYEKLKSGHSYLYYPVGSTSSDALSRLQEWLDNYYQEGSGIGS